MAATKRKLPRKGRHLFGCQLPNELVNWLDMKALVDGRKRNNVIERLLEEAKADAEKSS